MGTHSEAQLDTKFIDFMKQLNHFIKRGLGAKRYCRYVDDFVIFGWSRQRCVDALGQIQQFLSDKLHLVLSRFSLHKIKRGLNFVGYRTWQSMRFVRKHSLYTFSRAVQSGAPEALASCLGHAKRTASLRHMLGILESRRVAA
ncbi:MAG: hypothetical protein D4R79_02225 [Comamonadaceae bacterium]|nr:MAG: hypothetical protein D4R79_02225 [Comamonadaceae bacterium]